MELGKTLDIKDRNKWRKWLATHYGKEPEIWLIYYRKGSGKGRITYNDAVEEALCYGWIDSTVKGIDDQKYAQRFSPRNPKTPYSQTNKERLKKLISEGKVIESVLTTLSWLDDEKFIIDDDIIKEIKKNQVAWKNFRNYSIRYQHIRIGFVEGARKRPAEFKKRLRHLIKMSEQGKQFGFGGVEKYY
jgi:uncharacterized protein YdeI (YjbR/CyaY-like superfamily)